jgi:hypothetical protein
MYATFREVNCIAESIINIEDNIRHKEFSERNFHPSDMYKQPNAFIDFRVDSRDCIKKPNTIFCDWEKRHKICNEKLHTDRLLNGNDQKLFLFATKNKEKKPICPYIFTEPADACMVTAFNS